MVDKEIFKKDTVDNAPKDYPIAATYGTVLKSQLRMKTCANW